MSEYSYLFAIGGRDIPIKGEFREADELYKRVDGIRAYTLGTESRESKIVVLEDCWSNDKKTLREFLSLVVSRFRTVPSRCDTDGWHSYGTLLEKLGIERGIVHHFKEWKSVEEVLFSDLICRWTKERHTNTTCKQIQAYHGIIS